MTTTFHLNTDELDATFIERVKAAFPHRQIEIAVTEADETASLLADPASRERLLRGAADIEQGRNVTIPDPQIFR